MSKISSRSIKVAENIRDRKPFETYGALKATKEDGRPGLYWQSGQLSGPDLKAFQDHSETGTIDYVVWSYATPIAWHSTIWGWHRVAQKFSRTTSVHQGKLYLI